MTERSLPIRWLAEFVHRRGDLYAYRAGSTRAEEGIATQRRLQRDRPNGYVVEQAVQATLSIADVDFKLSGRVDGVDLTVAPALVEEFKTTRADPEVAHLHDGCVHWAQTLLYAALLARTHASIGSWHLRLIYCHPDTRQTHVFEREADRDELAAFLEETLTRYGQWVARQRQHETQRNAWLASRGFPFATYRPHQHATARRCYQVLRDRQSLLLEAPTGSGKTMGVLYPALKSLATTTSNKLLYLTSRGTGARAAQAALEVIDADRTEIRRITITAKEKACLVEGMPCAAEHCRYARGYYDKRDAAVAECLDQYVIGPETLETVARKHEVCPFELSLDTALGADVVICDYNYVLDPVVRLQRFADDDEIDLLIDEAHQLTSRTIAMLSVTIDRAPIRAALHEAPPAAIATRLRSLDRSLTTLRRLYGRDIETIIDEPLAVRRAAKRLVEECQNASVALLGPSSLRTSLFDAVRWLRADGWTQPDAYAYVLDTRDGELAVRLECLDPSRYLKDTLSRYRSHIRFSGTVSPLALYNDLHGHKETPAERAASPFREDQLGLLVVNDVNTYYQGRARSIDKLVELVNGVCGARRGHYLIAFPSYAYLDRFKDAATGRLDDICLRVQTPNMDEAERDAFLAALNQDEPVLAGVVLGGLFAESVDFSAVPLKGVIAVGVGLPPPTLMRTCQEQYFDHRSLNGKEVAFLQPAMTKVLQVTGRLLRSPEDRGIICLVDPRFCESEYQQFFPAHWQPNVVATADAGKVVAKFWEDTILTAS